MLFVTLLLLVLIVTISSSDDLSLYQYTSAGEIAQISYSSIAISNCNNPIIGMTTKCGSSIIFAFSTYHSSLIKSSPSLIDVHDSSIIIATTGMVADCKYTRNQLNDNMQGHSLTYGESSLSIEHICNRLATFLTQGMYKKDDEDDSIKIARPLAASSLLSTYDKDKKKTLLKMVENTGLVNDVSFATLGKLPQAVIDDMMKKRDECDDVGSLLSSIVTIIDDSMVSNDMTYEVECAITSRHGISMIKKCRSPSSFMEQYHRSCSR